MWPSTTPLKLIDQLEATYTVKLVVAQPLTEAQVASLSSGLEFVQSLEENAYLLRLNNTPKALDAVLDEIVRSNISLQHLEITPVTLEGRLPGIDRQRATGLAWSP